MKRPRGFIEKLSASVLLDRENGRRIITLHLRQTWRSVAPTDAVVVHYAPSATEDEVLAALRILREEIDQFLPATDGGPKPRRQIKFEEER